MRVLGDVAEGFLWNMSIQKQQSFDVNWESGWFCFVFISCVFDCHWRLQTGIQNGGVNDVSVMEQNLNKLVKLILYLILTAHARYQVVTPWPELRNTKLPPETELFAKSSSARHLQDYICHLLGFSAIKLIYRAVSTPANITKISVHKGSWSVSIQRLITLKWNEAALFIYRECFNWQSNCRQKILY